MTANIRTCSHICFSVSSLSLLLSVWHYLFHFIVLLFISLSSPSATFLLFVSIVCFVVLTGWSFDCLSSDAAAKETTSLVLLLLYEFEARVRLNDGEAEMIFERAISLPYTDAKTFETMAGRQCFSARHVLHVVWAKKSCPVLLYCTLSVLYLSFDFASIKPLIK